jgi:hypothetical protein
MEGSGGGGAQVGGLLSRFENVRTTRSQKKMVPCVASTPEYQRVDYLKPQHLPPDRVDQEANFSASSNMQETRFHRGFQRRHKADIQSDAARLENELFREQSREERARGALEATRDFREKNTYNILSGEGVGRECEFRQVGKKIVNPFHCMHATYAEHSRQETQRIKNSKHRFFEYPPPQMEAERAKQLFSEGLTGTARQTAIIGYGDGPNRRTRTQSVGVGDNFAHIRGHPPEQAYDPPLINANRSQIVFG